MLIINEIYKLSLYIIINGSTTKRTRIYYEIYLSACFFLHLLSTLVGVIEEDEEGGVNSITLLLRIFSL